MNLSKEMGYRFYDMGGVYSEDYKVDPLYIFKHGFFSENSFDTGFCVSCTKYCFVFGS